MTETQPNEEEKAEAPSHPSPLGSQLGGWMLRGYTGLGIVLGAVIVGISLGDEVDVWAIDLGKGSEGDSVRIAMVASGTLLIAVSIVTRFYKQFLQLISNRNVLC